MRTFLLLTALFVTPALASPPVPVRAEAMGRTAYIELLNEQKVTSTGRFMGLYGGRQNVIQRKLPWLLEFKQPSVKARYLYSPKWGWVDMLHFASGAWANSLTFVHGYRVLKGGEDNELLQEQQNEWSRWDYEDLISNLLGVCFQEYLASLSWRERTRNFTGQLNYYLAELGFVESPADAAPNWKAMMENEDQDDPAQNREYSPWHAPAHLNGGDGGWSKLDQAALDYLAGFQRWMGR